jgi:hypothetical protein
MSTFPAPTDLLNQYKVIIKTLRPDLNVDDTASEPIIRGKTLAGLLSGIYGDQQSVENDTFISSARPSALSLKGQDFNLPQQPATFAESPSLQISGVIGSPVPAGSTLLYTPTGQLYSTQSSVVIGSGGTVNASIICNSSGQIGNVSVGNTLQFISPPTGVTPTATLLEAIADGSDAESTDSYRARLLIRTQNAPSGGNKTDYPNYGFAADPSVRSVFIRRFGRGLGTVDVYVTAGTTDIDTAVTQGLSIVRVPSSDLLNTIQNYYNLNVPLTDCPGVFAPTEVPIDVTVNVDLASTLFTLSTVPSDSVYNPLGLTILALIQRELSRVLYKITVGGRVLPGSTIGYVIASDLEAQLDRMLSAVDNGSGQNTGNIPVLADREVQPLNGLIYNLPLVGNQICVPGSLVVNLGV